MKVFKKVTNNNEGGWHFSFKDAESIRRKIKSYSHQEYNTKEFTDIKNIEQKISKNIDLFGRKIDYKVVD